ncbi:MAG: NUDIX domain-containing protein [Myxococcota bacterium]
MSASEVPIQPAATVLCLRDGKHGVEVLLVRRNSKLVFHGGAWVFPGGRVDPADVGLGVADGALFEETAARAAAAREAREETSLGLDAEALIALSHWTTPPGFPRRFSTWFFIADARGGEVAVDQGEIDAYWWSTPDAAIARRAEGEIELPPPTFVSLVWLSQRATVEDAQAAARAASVERYLPRPVRTTDGVVSLYEGDSGYLTTDPEAAGPRHRLCMLRSGWRYERDT